MILEKPVKTIGFMLSANDEIGYGHLSRSLARALILDRFRVIFIGTISDKARDIFPDLSKFEVFETPWMADEISELIDQQSIDVLVTDAYNLDMDFCLELHKSPTMWLMVDDYFPDHELFDAFLSTSLSDDKKEKGDKFYLGIDYHVFHPSFKATNSDETESDTKNLLINFGGGDNRALVADLLNSEKCISLLSVFNKVTLISSDPIKSSLKIRNLDVLPYVNDMPKILESTDYAIGSCGVNSLERCVLGIPQIVFKTADNQSENFNFLLRKGCALTVTNVDECIDSLDMLLSEHELKDHLSLVSRASLDFTGEHKFRKVINDMQARRAA